MINTRSSRRQMFVKIFALKNFAIITGKHLCWSLFFIKSPQTWNFIKKRLQHKCYENSLFYGTPPMATSVILKATGKY